MLLTRELRFKATHSLKVKGWKKICHANGNQKRAGDALIITDTIFELMFTYTWVNTH